MVQSLNSKMDRIETKLETVGSDNDRNSEHLQRTDQRIGEMEMKFTQLTHDIDKKLSALPLARESSAKLPSEKRAPPKISLSAASNKTRAELTRVQELNATSNFHDLDPKLVSEKHMINDISSLQSHIATKKQHIASMRSLVLSIR